MDKLFDVILKNRRMLHHHLLNIPKEDLYTIPKGFNNNIWWNIAHVVVTTQILVYKFSDLDFTIEEELVNKYRKGTFPEGEPSEEEVEKISKYLFSTVEQMEADYKSGKFKKYNEYTTTPKVQLQNVEDALSFNVFHEGIHLGSILALKRAIASVA
ncbi:MAG: DinB family protein [Flavobacteriaceae bacterium]